jgi:proline dehydrogenase
MMRAAMAEAHDPTIVEAAQRYADDVERKADEFEFQMLYGIRDVEQRRLVDQQRHLRVYLPYGDQWYGYFMRRLAERPANLAFFLRSLIPVISAEVRDLCAIGQKHLKVVYPTRRSHRRCGRISYLQMKV